MKITERSQPGGRRRARRWLGLGAGVAVLAAACTADLGTLGGYWSDAHDVNDAGVVVGSSYVDSGSGLYHAFVRRPGEDLVDINGDHLVSTAQAVNEDGVVVGWGYRDGGTGMRAVLWDADGTAHDLPIPTSYQSYAYDINDSGIVIGSIDSGSTGEYRAFAFDTVSGQLTWLPFGQHALGINDAGDVVGTGCLGTTCAAVLWTAGSYTLVTLPGAAGPRASSAVDINDVGQILGTGPTTTSTAPVPLLWNDPTEPPVEVPIPGGPYSFVFDINDAGQIAGGAERAFVWDTTTSELSWLGRADRFSRAYAINEHGVAAGTAATGEPPPDEEAPEPRHATLFGAPD